MASTDRPQAATGQLVLFSPAKINVFFRVQSKREDGYHEVVSLYQAITLGDTLTIAQARVDSFTTTDPQLSTDCSNLVWQAVSLFRQETGYVQPLSIHLDKKIPMQAGLGGGSSNAATTLFGLRALSGYPLTEDQMKMLGGKLGSDVPFFFSAGSAMGLGRGEIIEPAPPYIQDPLWIVKPPRGLCTKSVYQKLRLDQLPHREEKQMLYNDLEYAAFSVDSSLQELKQQLLDFGFADVVLCGSGSAFFCVEGKKKYTTEEMQSAFPRLQVFYVTPLLRKKEVWYEI